MCWHVSATIYKTGDRWSVLRIRLWKHVVECSFLCPDNYQRNTRQCANITVPVVSAIIGHNVLVFAFLHHCDLLLDGGDVITWRTRERVYTEQVLVHNTYLYISSIWLQNAVIDKAGTNILESSVKITCKIESIIYFMWAQSF